MILNLNKELNFLCPVKCNNLIRLGQDNDGGYIVPEFLVKDCQGLLSFGIGDDYSFEQHWYQLSNVPIDTYDGTTDIDVDYINHIKQHVGRMDGYVTFDQAVKKFNQQNIFVKMDIEHAERQCISDIVDNYHIVSGLVIEFHYCNDTVTFKQDIVDLQQYYSIVHVHGNNCEGIASNGLPYILELTFVRKELSSSVYRNNVYLDNLDQPNDKNREDYHLIFN